MDQTREKPGTESPQINASKSKRREYMNARHNMCFFAYHAHFEAEKGCLSMDSEVYFDGNAEKSIC